MPESHSALSCEKDPFWGLRLLSLPLLTTQGGPLVPISKLWEVALAVLSLLELHRSLTDARPHLCKYFFPILQSREAIFELLKDQSLRCDVGLSWYTLQSVSASSSATQEAEARALFKPGLPGPPQSSRVVWRLAGKHEDQT